MFEYARFTDRARKVLQLANQEAQRLNHEYIGTEHILLGLIREGSGVAANVLKNLDIDIRKVRAEVEKIIQSGPDGVTMGKLPQTPRAKKVIEFAIEEARNLDHKWVGSEHLLLGLLREGEGVAAQVLTNLGLTLDEIRGGILKLLGQETPAEKPSKAPSLPKPVQPPSADERIQSLELQLWNVRVVLGALVGATAGALLLAQFGALMGLLLGGLVAALGWRSWGIVAGGSVGFFLGIRELPNDGGGIAGALLGALTGFLISEISSRSNKSA